MEQQLTFAFSSDSEAQYFYRHLLHVLETDRDRGIRAACHGGQVSVSAELGRNEPPERLAEWTAARAADYIIDRVEARLLRKMAAASIEAAPEEIDEMVACCQQLLNETDGGCGGLSQTGRKGAIRGAFLRCLAERPFLHMEGFLHFRLREYLGGLRDIAAEAVNEFLLNRQYREFIALLRYFVHFQEPCIAEVQLVHDGGNRFMLYDSRMRPLDGFPAEEVVVETMDRELNVEDMVVSTLISASPGRIHLHTRDHLAASVQTICEIFEERVELCRGCSVCAPILGERTDSGASLDPINHSLYNESKP